MDLLNKIITIIGISIIGSWCVMGTIFYIMAIVDAILN